MEKGEGINVRDLLKNVYKKLGERQEFKEVVFLQRVSAEITNSNNWSKTKIGFMSHDSARLFWFNGKCFVIGFGEKCIDYPESPYDCNILAFEFYLDGEDSEEKNKLERKVRQNDFFENSLVYGMSDGNLGIKQNGKFGKRMTELLKPRIKEFVAQEPEYDFEAFDPVAFKPLCIRGLNYKPEFADFLAEAIETVLKE